MRNRLIALLLPAVIAMLPSFTQAAATPSYAAKITIAPVRCALQPGNSSCVLSFNASPPNTSIRANTNYLIRSKGSFGASGACSLFKVNQPDTGLLTIFLDRVGTCTVTASLNEWDNGYMAVGSAQYSFQIPKANVSFRDMSTDQATSLLVGSTISNSVDSSYNVNISGPRLDISVNTPDNCEIIQLPRGPLTELTVLQTAYQVTGKSRGICTITFTTPETDDFFAFSKTKSFTITSNKTIATLTVCDTPDIVVGATGQACFSTNAPGGAALTSRDASICTVSGSTVTAVAPGVCEVDIATSPSDTLDRATAVQRINIINGSTETSKSKQVIAFGLPPQLSVGDSAGISVTGGDSGNPVTLSSQSTDVCTVSGATVTAMDVGVCRITANQDGNDSYNAADPALLSFNIGGATKTKQSIAIMDIAPLAAGESAPVDVVEDASGQPVVLSVLTPDTCAVTGTTLKALAAGTCTIVADKAGDNTYAPAQAKLNVSITAKGYPFAAAISAAGSIDNQTLTVSFTPSSDDAGLTGAMFVGASVNSQLYLLGSSGWVPYKDGDALTPLMAGTLAQQDIILLSNADMTPLVGAQLYFGYGLGTDLADAYANMVSRKTLIEGYIIH
ncbi:MAG: hypothetical protein ACXWFI_08890 [Methylobacter sp.]